MLILGAPFAIQASMIRDPVPVLCTGNILEQQCDARLNPVGWNCLVGSCVRRGGKSTAWCILPVEYWRFDLVVIASLDTHVYCWLSCPLWTHTSCSLLLGARDGVQYSEYATSNYSKRMTHIFLSHLPICIRWKFGPTSHSGNMGLLVPSELCSSTPVLNMNVVCCVWCVLLYEWCAFRVMKSNLAHGAGLMT